MNATDLDDELRQMIVLAQSREVYHRARARRDLQLDRQLQLAATVASVVTVASLATPWTIAAQVSASVAMILTALRAGAWWEHRGSHAWLRASSWADEISRLRELRARGYAVTTAELLEQVGRLSRLRASDADLVDEATLAAAEVEHVRR